MITVTYPGASPGSPVYTGVSSGTCEFESRNLCSVVRLRARSLFRSAQPPAYLAADVMVWRPSRPTRCKPLERQLYLVLRTRTRIFGALLLRLLVF